MNTPTHRPLILTALLAVLLVAACSSAGASAPPGSPAASSPAASAPSAPGSDTGAGQSDGPDTGVTSPTDPGPVDPGAGQPALVLPRPGQLEPHPVGAALLEPDVDGRHVIVKVTWWSGVEPCNVLDSVKIDRTGSTINLTLIEGSSDLNAMCIELAEQKSTIVDLGELEPGEYTITSNLGEAEPVTITVT